MVDQVEKITPKESSNPGAATRLQNEASEQLGAKEAPAKAEARPLKGTLENPALGEEYYSVPGVLGPQDRIQVTKEQEDAAFKEL
ncbi:MAG: hypothetical protein K2Z81_10405, partial [Cyanobacteria bacterium]|nr:hypothetical protein [Cyanobacteriota bacterium]